MRSVRSSRARSLRAAGALLAAAALTLAVSSTLSTASAGAPAKSRSNSAIAAKLAAAKQLTHRNTSVQVSVGKLAGTYWAKGVRPSVRASVQHTATDSGIDYGPGTLQYYGGRVLHTNETALVFWDPNNQLDPNYKALLEQYLGDAAAASGSTDNPYSVLTQYGDHDGPVQYQASYVGAFDDTDPYPPAGCSFGTVTCLSDPQLQSELDTYLDAQHVARPDNRIFFIVTPKGVESCFGDGSDGDACSNREYCAYHSGFPATGGATLYADIPYAGDDPGCDNGQYPNDPVADNTIDSMSHENREAIDDPDVWAATTFGPPLAWYNVDGGESSDECVFDFSNAQGPAGAQYTSTINGHHYYIQDDWSNVDAANGGDGCAQSGTDVGPTARFSTGTSGARFTFDASASSDPDPGDSVAQYLWDFGDGSTGTGVTTSHLYFTAGSHTVRLTVVDTHGAFIWEEHDIVAPDPCSDPSAIVGTNAANTINGTPGDDIICGLGGADHLNGNGGDDVLIGGDGNDVLSGGAGNDILSGGSGTDSFNSGVGDDVIDASDRTDSTLDTGDNHGETITCGTGSDDVVFDAFDHLNCAVPNQLTCNDLSGTPSVPSLTVPSDADCFVFGAVVNGTVTVAPAGSATVISTTITGATNVSGSANFDVTTFRGPISVPPTGSATVTRSALQAAATVSGELDGDSDALYGLTVNTNGLSQLSNSTVAHNVLASGGDVFFSCGAISGSVTLNKELPGRFSVFDGEFNCSSGLTIGGSFVASNSPSGPGLDGAIVRGTIRVQNEGFGGTDDDISVLQDVRANGSVTISQTGTAQTYLLGNQITANLVCQNNAPDPTDEADGNAFPNTVFGHRTGETCASPSF